jgi:DNA-directed RNA polymerase subunit K/omega
MSDTLEKLREIGRSQQATTTTVLSIAEKLADYCQLLILNRSEQKIAMRTAKAALQLVLDGPNFIDDDTEKVVKAAIAEITAKENLPEPDVQTPPSST